MPDLSALIERVEALTGPDREVDSAIAVSLGFYKIWKSKHGYWNVEGIDGERFTVPGRPNDAAFDPATGQKLPPEQRPCDWADEAGLPEWTTSLDAAGALVERVLPGCGLSVEHHPVYGDWWDAAIFDRIPKTIANARKKTAALAVCLAALRALQDQEGRDG